MDAIRGESPEPNPGLSSINPSIPSAKNQGPMIEESFGTA